jgi:hypothetical protein
MRDFMMCKGYGKVEKNPNAIQTILKYNPLVSGIYNVFMDFLCKDVKAYIFVATTGRSGSESLSRIFDAVDGSVCFHEPYPNMFNDYPEGINEKEYFRKLFYKRKRINIKRSAKTNLYYLETNHSFVKNFADFAINEFGYRIIIIHLVRDVTAVARSFYKIGSIPGVTSRGKIYLIDPRNKSNIIGMSDVLFDDNKFKHDAYKCLWYWYEIQTRIKALKIKYKNTVFYRLDTNELNDFGMLKTMFNELDIPVNENKLINLAGTRSNVKMTEKKFDISEEVILDMNSILLDKMEARFGKNFWL